MNMLTKLGLACILCSLLICGSVSAASSPDCLRVELDGDMGDCQELIIDCVCITDCNGKHFVSKNNKGYGLYTHYHFYDRPHNTALVDLSGSGLNCDKQFKKVQLHLTLYRCWMPCSICERYDKFTLNVTDLVTKEKDKPNTVRLKGYNHYKFGKADAVDICDCDGNKLKHFDATHDEGYHGSWDYSSRDMFCVDLDADLGANQKLYLDGVCITDCCGYRFVSTFQDAYQIPRFAAETVDIYLLGSGLKRDKPFNEVKLYFTLERRWGFCDCCVRYDKFTLNVTDLVTKEKDKPNTVRLKGYNHYKVGKADAVDICDCDGNKLKHFDATHKEGKYGSWD